MQKKRFFVLDEKNALVVYYKNEESTTAPLGKYAIEDARLEGRFGEFVIETPGWFFGFVPPRAHSSMLFAQMSKSAYCR